MKQCPFCKEEIHDEAVKCKHCKRIIATVPDVTVMPAEPKSNLDGIAGWLFLPVLAIIVTPASFVFKNLEVFNSSRNFGGRIIIDYPAMTADLVILLCLSLVGYSFFKKKTVTPVLFILYILISSFAWTVHDTFASQMKSPIVANLFTSFVLIPYFVFSKRVKLTFKNELDNAVWVDRQLALITPAVNSFYAFLWKTRKFLVLEILLFVLISVVAQSFLRAVFVLKDISAFRQLLF